MSNVGKGVDKKSFGDEGTIKMGVDSPSTVDIKRTAKDDKTIKGEPKREDEKKATSRSPVNRIFEFYDPPVNWFTNVMVNRANILQRLEFERGIAEKQKTFNSVIEYYFSMIGVIHERVATLVGHLSIMIAVSSFVLSSAKNPLGTILLTFEVFMYILLTIYTIGALKSIGIQSDQKENEYINDLKEQIANKYGIFQVSLALTVLLTVLLLIFSIIALVYEG